MTEEQRRRLRAIKTFQQLIAYLRDDLDWPIDEGHDEDDLTFDWSDDLGLKDDERISIKEIKQLRPLETGQPWGIFFVNFEKKSLPIVILRRVLNALVLKKRAGANRAQRAAWQQRDLLFISAYGQENERQLTFAHFSEPANEFDASKATLRVLGWDDDDTSLKLDHVAEMLKAKLTWPKDTSDIKAWRQRWSEAFELRHRQVIDTAEDLALRLAELAKRIRNRMLQVLPRESENGELRKLLKGFQAALIHDLDEPQFADMYAQTITYGLFSAAVSRTVPGAGTAVHQGNVVDMVPVTNPFLREMLSSFLKAGGRRGKLDFDELGIQEVVDLLNDPRTHMDAVLRDFGNRTRGEDPVIHFYEAFLKAYDKKLKVQRGVFYTPQPVVSYIVRSVHELLQTEFGLADGLADTTTWGSMLKKHPGLKLPPLTDEPGETRTISPDEPFVQLLDPATGTATFLVEVIAQIAVTMKTKWGTALGLKTPAQRDDLVAWRDPKVLERWNEYVPKHLLPRLHAYELMMAPYAIAHMKIGLKLAETGYRFGTEERARIYLTNALEPWVKQLPLIGFEALAHEAAAVNKVKRHTRFTVVIGNPPYSHMTANPSQELQGIVDIYRKLDGETIREKGAIMFERTLQDDYVKFHALADRLTSGRPAIRAYITNSAYLDNPTLRGMRCYLTHGWETSWFIDLNGDVKRAGDKDENVFDIRTGVAIAVLLRHAQPEPQTRMRFQDLSGTRVEKYAFLKSSSIGSSGWTEVSPHSPYYLFRPQFGASVSELDGAPLVHDIFDLKSEAIKTNRDHLVIGDSDDEVLRSIRTFIDPSKTTVEIKCELALNDNAQWSVDAGRRDCRETFDLSNLASIAYRPFDDKRIYYHPSVVFNPRPVLSANVLGRDNLVFLTSRRIRTDVHAHFFVSNKIVVKEMLSSADNCNGYPLYRFEKNFSEERRVTNFTPAFLKTLSTRLGLRRTGDLGLPTSLTAEEILHYIYAVFHSPVYRSRYAELLKIDFARLPLTEKV